MRRHGNIITICLTLGLFACNSTADRQERSSENSTLSDSVTLTSIQQTEIETKTTFECVRGQAEPIIKKEYFPNTTFTLQPDSLTAIETVNFDNGDRLTIKNWGCEYYVLTFSFETTKFQQDTANLKFWYQATMQLMTSMLAGIDAPIDIKRGLVFLESYYLKDEKNNFKNLKLGDEIDFDGNEIRHFVTLDRIEKISNNKFGVTVSFAIGPL